MTRLAIKFKQGLKRNNKTLCISTASFLAHLFNQGVVHEIIILEILIILIENPTNDSIEVAVAILKESGMKLIAVSAKICESVFETFKNILHEGKLDKRVRNRTVIQ